jgi:hypothetical protein
MAATLLLLTGAVPLGDTGGESAGRRQRPRGPTAHLLHLVVREALEQILDSTPPGPPPNTPAVGSGGGSMRFTFPTSLTATDVTARLEAARSSTVGRKSAVRTAEDRPEDGNEAEDELEDDTGDAVDGAGRKRCRVLSFSGSSTSSCRRRVPHKRSRKTSSSTDLPPDEAGVSADVNEGGCSIVAAATDDEKGQGKGTWRSSPDLPPRVEQLDQVVFTSSQEQWRLLGQELRGVARKFASSSSGVGSTGGAPSSYSVKISARYPGDCSGGGSRKSGGELSSNVVCLAVNFLLWRLLKRLFAADV